MDGKNFPSFVCLGSAHFFGPVIVLGVIIYSTDAQICMALRCVLCVRNNIKSFMLSILTA
jgi:hypothetical protein